VAARLYLTLFIFGHFLLFPNNTILEPPKRLGISNEQNKRCHKEKDQTEINIEEIVP